jgi:hypothetical protein
MIELVLIALQRSFIFRKRVRTPPIYLRKKELAGHLEAQMQWKRDEQRGQREEKDFIERIEQIHLAESCV